MPPRHAKRQKVGKETDNPTAPDFQSFAPDGDVVFVVNNDTRVRVHSAVMKGASRVFSTLLGPNFMEGQALAAAPNTETGPFEIALPEEESSICFGWICRALHCQSATMLWEPISTEIVKIWSIVDKYDMKQSMQLSVMFWSQNTLPKAYHSKDLWLILLVCFLNNDSASYKTATRRLLWSEGSFLANASETEKLVENGMPGRFLYKLAANLQEARTNAQSKVANLVYKEVPSLMASNKCPTEKTNYFDYLLELKDESGDPVCFLATEASHNRIIKALLALGNWLSRYGTLHGGSCENCAEVQDKLREAISDARPIYVGLCLGCFEGDNTCPEHKD